jgi:ABC-type branched-subunit amino acid transport system substrate-binding protein
MIFHPNRQQLSNGNNMLKKNLLLVFCFATLFSAKSQSAQDDYLEAKRLFFIKDYVSADAAFMTLKQDAVFGAYSDFYRGLIQYHLNNKGEAVILWSRMLSEYPNWEKQVEVLYWLSLCHFQEGDFDRGLTFLNNYTHQSLNVSLANYLISRYMSELPVDLLTGFQKNYPELRSLAFLLASRINQQPIGEQDRQLLKDLIDTYELPLRAVMELEIANIKKSYYDVAVVLPFVYDGMSDPTATIRNTLVMDLYQGLQTAVESLSENDINIRIHSFDTYKEADTVASFAQDLKDMDLIIGPLYPGPIEMVKEISRRHQINMINPLSNNSSYVSDNPFAFLARPSYETMARALADFVLKQSHKKSAFIYFSKDARDSLFAETYRAIMIRDSIEVLDFRSIDDLLAKQLLDQLTEQYEYYYPKSKLDSLLDIEGRFIKTRTLREEENQDEVLDSLAFYELDEDGNLSDPDDPKRLLAYEMKYEMPLDTVGHILVVSRSLSIYNNFVSAKASRLDSIGIYGYSNWFDNKLVNYELMDQVDATVAVADYFDKESDQYEDFKRKIIRKYEKLPSDFHVQGYELMKFLGSALKKHGKYFQFGLYEEGMHSGELMTGFEYPGINDNQMVPVLQIENYEIKKVN